MRLSMLAAGYGDCLWIEHEVDGRTRRIVVDGGTVAGGRRLRSRLSRLPGRERHIDLLVVTHVDADHIGGVLALLADPPPGLTVGEVWFNGRRHLPRSRGPAQGDRLTAVLDELPDRYPWNVSVGGEAVVTAGPGAVRRIGLGRGATFTLLSPTPAALAALAVEWDEIAGRAVAGVPSAEEPQPVPRAARPRAVEALAATRSRPDRTAANGSSIAGVLELGGRSVLLAADAHPAVLVPALRVLATERRDEQVRFDAVKLPHHGSQGNVTEDLLGLLSSPRWLVSTNGERFGHPDPEAVARVILRGGPNPQLCFNYRSPQTRRWDSPALMSRYGYDVAYPAARGGGLTVDL